MDLSRCTKLLILLLSIHLIVVFDFSDGYGTLKVTFHSFEYSTHASRCDWSVFYYANLRKCDPKFQVTLTQHKYGDLLDYKQPGDYTDQDKVAFENHIGVEDNPITRLIYGNTGQINFKVTIFDSDPSDEEVIFELIIDLKTTRNSGQISTVYINRDVRLSVGYSFRCAEYYHGSLCNQYCEPRDDTLGAHYTCDFEGNKVCMKGWTGTTCGKKIECKGNSSQVCLNGGVCKQMDATNYQCECPKGYLGKHCEDSVFLQCRSVVCQNGGTCQGTGGSDYKCICRPGFVGMHCETDKIRCNYKNCPSSGGKCREFIRGFECICASGFRGTQCDIDVDECAASNPCTNGGTCTNTVGGFNCICPAGLTGSLCQTNTDECTQPQPSPHCGDGTRCVNTPDTFACLPVDLDDCAGGKKCLNGGECVDMQQHFICLCRTGFNGPTCNETAIGI